MGLVQALTRALTLHINNLDMQHFHFIVFKTLSKEAQIRKNKKSNIRMLITNDDSIHITGKHHNDDSI